MFKKQRSTLSILLILFILASVSCKSKFEKLKASNDNAKKYQAALALYNKKKYSKALELFETLVQRYRGQAQAEDLYYYYAYANYNLKDYTSARYHFKTFSDTYPQSPRAEECKFMEAYCYYLDSPIFSLDQENTTKAIESLQLFINLYPKSERVAEAGKLIQNLRDKLEKKSFENAKLYLTIGYYNSAVMAFGNTLRDYPDTKYAEEIDYLTIKSQYLYATHSRIYTQVERFNQVIAYEQQFAEKYPTSKYLKDVQSYKKDSESGVESAKRELAAEASDIKYQRRFQKKDTVTGPGTSEKVDLNKKIPN